MVCFPLNDIVGWTGERIVFAGDSAGANICLAVTLHAIQCNVRIPDGVLSVYGTLLVKFLPSPSRLLSLMDTMLPMGFLAQCLAGKIPSCKEIHSTNN